MEEVVLLEETSIWKIAVKSTEKDQGGIGVVNTICLAFFPNVFFTTATMSGTTPAVMHHQNTGPPRREQYVKKQQHQ